MSTFLHLFVLFKILKVLDKAKTWWGGLSALLSLQKQMLISSKNTLTDTPRSNV